MSSSTNHPQAHKQTTQHEPINPLYRTRIKRMQRLLGPGPAHVYEDACRLLSDKLFLWSKSLLIGQLLREIESCLFQVMINPYEELPERGKPNARKKRIETVVRTLGFRETSDIISKWSKINLQRLSHRNRLDDFSHEDKIEMKDVFNSFSELLDSLLNAWERSFLNAFDRIDDLLKEEQLKSDSIKTLLNNIPSSYPVMSYFYKQVPLELLHILSKAGAFKYPPLPYKTSDDIGHTHPKWAASEYLARVAIEKPNAVYKVLINLPATWNQAVHLDIMSAVLHMNPSETAEIVQRVARWLLESYQLLLPIPKVVIKLSDWLARTGESENSLLLLRSLLMLNVNDDGLISKIKLYEYKRILKSLVQSDVSLFLNLDLLELIIEQLAVAVKVESNEITGRSTRWRRAIEDHSQNIISDRGYRGTLVTAVRNLAEKLQPEHGKKVLQVIEKRKGDIFKRINLYLRRIALNVDLDGTARLLVDVDIFNNIELHHEYYHLLKEAFPMLSCAQKNQYLTLVEKGLDKADWINFREGEKGIKPKTESNWRSWHRWQYEKLLPIIDCLTGEWKEKINKLVEEFGPQSHPDFYHYICKTWHGPVSPISEEQLEKISVNELIEFLHEWTPIGKPMTPSPQGLAQSLSAVVSRNPRKYTSDISLYIVLDQTYVSALIQGWKMACQESNSFEWKSVLWLCMWAVEQPMVIEGRESKADIFDSGWDLCKLEIANLLSRGLINSTNTINISERQNVWSIIDVLLNDHDPNENKDDEDKDPLGTAINSVRESAMEAAIRYGLWLKSNLDQQDDHPEASLDDFPELKNQLDRHLDRSFETSLAICAVYGHWFPWLALLSDEWARQNVNEIFPLDEREKRTYEAAWNAYISFNETYTQTLKMLVPQYEKAIAELKQNVETVSHRDNCLGEHLLMSHIQGDLVNLGLTYLIDEFFSIESDEVRGHALEFVGSVLGHPKSDVNAELVERMQRLFESRIAVAQVKSDSRCFQKEMESFEIWMESEKFEGQWMLQQLRETYHIRDSIHFHSFVIEKIEKLSDHYPLESVECLELMVQKNEWGFHGLQDKIKVILKHGLIDEASRKKSMEIINLLVSLNYLEFRGLLSNESEPAKEN